MRNGLKGKWPAASNWAETSYWEDATESTLHAVVGTQVDFKLKGPVNRIRDTQKRVCPWLSDSRPRIKLLMQCVYVDTASVWPAVFWQCSLSYLQWLHTQSLASGWPCTHQNHSSLPSTDPGPVAASDKLSSNRAGRKNHWVLKALDLLASGSKDEW